MSEISKAYEPQSVEAKWYQFWLDQNCFVADPARVSEKRPAYSIVIPPPNVTGVLTLGHVLNNTIQDILARKARMDGKEVLWLPGTDHAGIATEAVVVRTLKKAGEIRHRNDLTREQFLEKVWAWREKHGEKHGGIILQQLKALGASCDWTRTRFTMEPEYSACVTRVFVDLYKKGLIYRGKRMVNWDPAARTALSDEEVIMQEERGHLWHIKYPLLDEKGEPSRDDFLVVATTRPETMLGDEAVAVNPRDERYQKIVGRKCFLPLRNKSIPIIADEAVDPKFGTGCVKVTPAHDKADYEMAERHKLPLTIVIGPDGVMTPEASGDFVGLDRMEARKAVVEKLEEQKLLLEVEDYTHNVGYSERTHVPIEPYLSEQWFMKYPSVEASTKAVESGALKFYPERWSKTYSHWMHNIKDWCISRQLWWGHRVPVWRARPEIYADNILQAGKLVSEALANWPNEVVWRDAEIGQELHAKILWPEVALGPSAEHLGPQLEALGFIQDPDVLDTWASSWLWPFATMGWPEQTETLKKFYPTTDLVTGPDIIFFWVARMIMAGYEYMGEMPFRNVYFTGIIRDKLGRKMSKSLGNSPDPLDLINKFGADALRFGVMRSAPLGQDVTYDEQNVELGRNFCNKLWNACRFRQMQGSAGVPPANSGVSPESSVSGEALGGTPNAAHETRALPEVQIEGEIRPELLTSDDKWILLRLDTAIREINAAFSEYRFNEVTATLYRFFWSEYCDWYVEASKATLQGSDAARKANVVAVIDFVLSNTLRLFHPFLPFITEELWHGLGYNADLPADQGGNTIMFAHWPKPLDDDFKSHYGLDESDERFVNAKYELVTLGRNLRRESNIQAGKKVKFVFKPAAEFPQREAQVLKLLLNAEEFQVDPNFQPAKGTAVAPSPLGELYLPLAGLIDVPAERARLTKELARIEAEIEKVQQKLNNPNFVQKVPATVLEEHQQRLTDWQSKRDQVNNALRALES
jgi:valyl-tRNA synthetase